MDAKLQHTRGSHTPQHIRDEATGDVHGSNLSISNVINYSRLCLFPKKKTKRNLAARTPKKLAVIES